MGTRGAYGFIVDGEEKITYNHFDSYPFYLGISIKKQINSKTIEELTQIAKNVKLIKRTKTGKIRSATQAQIKKVRDFEKENGVNLSDFTVNTKDQKDWYCILRNGQGTLNLPFMIDDSLFLNDSLFCEWAYIANIDSGCLEIYKGFNKNPNADGRYAKNLDSDSEYYGVVLLDEIPFELLQQMDDDTFCNLIDKKIEQAGNWKE